MIGRRIRYMSRYREIAVALARHGFGFVVEELGLRSMLSLPKRLVTGSEPPDPKTYGKRIRMVLEDLGPTFIKLGQIASTRSDLFSEDILRELENLQDHISPFPFSDVRRTIERELGPLEKIFSRFDETPLAAASIGQVHRAVLTTGEEVAVKVRRPFIETIVEADLEILRDLASIADHRFKWAARMRLRQVVEEFAEALESELDFANEGNNAERIAAQFAGDESVRIPKIYWEYTRQNVLTMEFISGVKMTDEARLAASGHDRRALAERYVKAMLHQILMEGFFHADPHPGNLFVLPDGSLAFIDFGLVGRFGPETKEHFIRLILAMLRQNTDGVIKTLLRMGIVPEDVDMEQLWLDTDRLRDKYTAVPLSRIRLGDAIRDLFQVASRHRIRIPANLTLAGKAILVMEGVAAQLHPELNMMEIAMPFGNRLIRERLDPRRVADRLWKNVTEYGEMLSEIPQDLQALIRDLRRGKFRVQMEIPRLELFLKRLERISNRLTFSILLLAFSIIMTGLIIGLSLSNRPALLLNSPAIQLGFVIALLMILWLMFSIFRSGRF
ncbi:MAG: ABC transporter [Thermoactinomycetaceae bacterium]|nr:ABC transporter [Bacillota bacterium]MBO2532769.1 ABC transporter [Thermoactinomycetaceae bacterium]